MSSERGDLEVQADRTLPRGNDDARLSAAQRNDAVCLDERPRQPIDRRRHAAPLPSGMHSRPGRGCQINRCRNCSFLAMPHDSAEFASFPTAMPRLAARSARRPAPRSSNQTIASRSRRLSQFSLNSSVSSDPVGRTRSRIPSVSERGYTPTCRLSGLGLTDRHMFPITSREGRPGGAARLRNVAIVCPTQARMAHLSKPSVPGPS